MALQQQVLKRLRLYFGGTESWLCAWAGGELGRITPDVLGREGSARNTSGVSHSASALPATAALAAEGSHGACPRGAAVVEAAGPQCAGVPLVPCFRQSRAKLCKLLPCMHCRCYSCWLSIAGIWIACIYGTCAKQIPGPVPVHGRWTGLVCCHRHSLACWRACCTQRVCIGTDEAWHSVSPASSRSKEDTAGCRAGLQALC